MSPDPQKDPLSGPPDSPFREDAQNEAPAPPPSLEDLADRLRDLHRRVASLSRRQFALEEAAPTLENLDTHQYAHVNLIGSYGCWLSSTEQNAWTEFCRKLDTFEQTAKCDRRVAVLTLQLKSETDAKTRDELARTLEEQLELQDILRDKMYGLAKAWHEELRPKPEEEVPDA